jgi:hypothetical protein
MTRDDSQCGQVLDQRFQIGSRVILRCLERDKRNRYTDAAQLASALRDAAAPAR